jgi:tetratricopeptide (TPR) repeat protein
MKSFYTALLAFSIIVCFNNNTYAQTGDDARSLVKEGVQLNKDGKYPEAIEKYNQALKIDSNNIYANYGIGYSLFNSGKGREGIPYLEKVIKANTSLTAMAYDLLGSIYDKDHEPGKAIDAFNSGIKADPKYQSLYYNLGLAYFRDKQYAEAEKNAIAAIKLDPKHANSQRMYALVCFHQNKRAAALLGFCSFILLEPNTPRSAEAFGNIQHILQGGILKPAPGEKSPQANDANTIALNQAITQAVAGTGKMKYASAADLLTAQLKGIFTAVEQLAEKQNDDDFFRKYLASYFYQLAQSPNMPAFARQISINTPESAKWVNDNPRFMNDLYTWVKTTERGF